MGVYRELKRGRSGDRLIMTEQVTLNCKHAAEKKVGLCVGITYQHGVCLGEFFAPGTARTTYWACGYVLSTSKVERWSMG